MSCIDQEAIKTFRSPSVVRILLLGVQVRLAEKEGDEKNRQRA